MGGFGGVFLAGEVVRGTVLRQLALKIIPDSSEAQLAELIAATNLNHPHLIQSYSAGECTFSRQESLYLAMELAQGSLEQGLQQGRFNTTQTRQFIQEVASALVYLHNQKRVHRDLKPGNILQVKQTWKLSDFGLVRQMDLQSYVYTSNFAGTIVYTPPEGFESQISPAWDMWSLGIMLVEMTTGELPYKFNDLNQLMKRVINGSLQLPPLPKEFEPIILGCLQTERQRRWTAQQVLEAVTPKTAPSIFSTPQISSFTETFPNGIKLEMVAIPAGEFLMGSPDSDPSANNSEKPQHRVKVGAFAIGKYPITQEQYKAVMGNNPSHFQIFKQQWLQKAIFVARKHPVDSVSWHKAQEFCNKLTKTTGRIYRLPTEAEWEYTCRAGTKTRYYYGDNENLLGEYAWYQSNSNQTQPVGEKSRMDGGYTI